MSGPSVQRIIEQQAAAMPGMPALTSSAGTLTYRELNLRANAVARRLVMSGLRRGGMVTVKMEKAPQTAVLLLAVLKAGAAYMWLDPQGDTSWPRGLSICLEDGPQQQWQAVDVASLLAGAEAGPGLPVLSRPSDIACVLPQPDGREPVLVPHETIMMLRADAARQDASWGDDAGALDLWIGLMSGVTVEVAAAQMPAAAA